MSRWQESLTELGTGGRPKLWTSRDVYSDASRLIAVTLLRSRLRGSAGNSQDQGFSVTAQGAVEVGRYSLGTSFTSGKEDALP